MCDLFPETGDDLKKNFERKKGTNLVNLPEISNWYETGESANAVKTSDSSTMLVLKHK